LAFFGAGSVKTINSLGTVSVSTMCAVGVDSLTIKALFVPVNYTPVNSNVVSSNEITPEPELIVEEVVLPAIVQDPEIV
jgi:hypothetical protein